MEEVYATPFDSISEVEVYNSIAGSRGDVTRHCGGSYTTDKQIDLCRPFLSLSDSPISQRIESDCLVDTSRVSVAENRI